jgi:hypothetical protein
MQVKKLLLLLLMTLPSIAFAGNPQANEQRIDEELPDAELLEFIAEFEPLEGQWIDPVQLNMIFAENHNGKDDK